MLVRRSADRRGKGLALSLSGIGLLVSGLAAQPAHALKICYETGLGDLFSLHAMHVRSAADLHVAAGYINSTEHGLTGTATGDADAPRFTFKLLETFVTPGTVSRTWELNVDDLGGTAAWQRFDNSESGGEALTRVDCPPEGNLVFWNKLGSVAEVTHSEVGPSGEFTAGAFVPGMFGNAYKAENGLSEGLSFPKEVIPTGGSGAIEFWAKLEDVPSGFIQWGDNPLFTDLVDSTRPHGYYTLTLNGNQRSLAGLIGGAGEWYLAGTSEFTISHTYEDILGVGLAQAWHHYALVWDRNGLRADRKVAVFLDGKLHSELWNTAADDGFPDVGEAFVIVMANNEAAMDVLVDNIKIWDYPKTSFEDRFVE